LSGAAESRPRLPSELPTVVSPLRNVLPHVFDTLRREPAVAITLGYLLVAMAGIFYNYWFYRAFDIPVLTLSQISDFLVAGLQQPMALLLVLSTFPLCWLMDLYNLRSRRRHVDALALLRASASLSGYQRLRRRFLEWRVGEMWYTQLSYVANATGTAGTLTVSDGTHTAQLTLIGQYSADAFHLAAGASSGTELTSTTADNATVMGGGAADVLTGTTGNDIIVGGQGGDTLTGGAGSDTFMFRSSDAGGVDTITDFDAGASGDMLGIGALLQGYSAGDDLSPYISMRESGTDTIVGGNDADTVYGGSGNDVIDGSGGNDFIIGGYGADQLTGGGGNDTFVYLDTKDTNDTITDFATGDKIDLSAIDANPGLVGDQGFTFGGTTATAHGVWYAQVGGNVVVYVDTDGNAATAELAITLNGVSTVNSGDFLLGP